MEQQFHAQNFAAIIIWQFSWEQHNISTKSESWLKRLGEIGPGSHLQPADVKMSKKSGIIPEKIVIVRF